jgi:hypothetical protein
MGVIMRFLEVPQIFQTTHLSDLTKITRLVQCLQVLECTVRPPELAEGRAEAIMPAAPPGFWWYKSGSRERSQVAAGECTPTPEL